MNLETGTGYLEKHGFPLISIVIPCKNEIKFISNCLESILYGDYPLDKIEVLVVDGMSDDGTREILSDYFDNYDFIKIIDNFRKITPIAFNLGIKNSTGSIIVIMSSHATFAKDYLTKCIAYSEKYKIENVGGSWKVLPRDNSFIGKCIVTVFSSAFGVGNASYRIDTVDRPTWVDTVAYGCYRREVFNDIGFFNENLVRTQDMEFNNRLTKAGGRILLVPNAVIYYYSRTELKSFLIHNIKNGIWVILPFKYSSNPVSLRHLVPFAFTSGIIALSIASLFADILLLPLVLILLLYFSLSLLYSIKEAHSQKDWRLLFALPIIYFSLHFSYGLGSIIGLFRLFFIKK